jgi:hypothetical protein
MLQQERGRGQNGSSNDCEALVLVDAASFYRDKQCCKLSVLQQIGMQACWHAAGVMCLVPSTPFFHWATHQAGTDTVSVLLHSKRKGHNGVMPVLVQRAGVVALSCVTLSCNKDLCQLQ